MSTAEEKHQSVTLDAPASIQVSIVDLLTVLWQRRNLLAAVTGIGLLLALGYSLLIPNQYESTAQLMPPDQQSLSNVSILSALTGSGSIASMGGLMSARVPAGIFIGILDSQTAQNDIIDHFNLRRVYHCKLYIDARSILSK